MIFVRLTTYYLKTLFSPLTLLAIFGFLSANIFFTYSLFEAYLPVNLLEKVSFMFVLPLEINGDIFRWLLLLLPFLIIPGNLLFKQFKNPPVYLFVRMESFSSWFHSLLFSCCIFIFISTGLSFLFTFVILALLDADLAFASLNIMNGKIILKQWLVFFFTILCLFLFKVMIFMLSRNELFSLLVTIVVSLSALTLDHLMIQAENKMFITEFLYAKTIRTSIEFPLWISISSILVLCLYFVLVKVFMLKHEKALKIM